MSIAALAVALTLLPAAPAELEYGPETTVITEPKREDGTIDYVAALNARLSEGVTPANNAAVEVMLTLDRRDFDGTMQAWYADVLDRMGVEPPAEAPMFVPFEDMGGLGDLSEFEIQEMYAEAMQRPWTADEFPILAEWLETNRQVLALIEKASKKDRFYVPLSSPGEEREQLIQVLMPHLAYLREVSLTLGIRANRSLAEGDVDRAWRDVMTIHRLARLGGQEPIIISHLVAIAISRRAGRQMEFIATSTDLTAESAAAMIASIRSLDPLPPMKQAFDLGDRYSMLDIAQDPNASAEVNMNWSDEEVESNPILRRMRALYDPNRTLRALNEISDQSAQIASEAKYSIVAARLEAFDEALEKRFQRTKSRLNPRSVRDLSDAEIEEILTELMIDVAVPSVTRSVKMDWMGRAQQDLALVALALGGHDAEHGRFPDELSQLAPRFFEEIPPDRFANQPLMYRVEGDTAMIWSVGHDLENNGGNEEDDLVVTLERGAATDR